MKFKLFMGIITVAVLVFFGVIIFKTSSYQVQEGDTVLVNGTVTDDATGEEITELSGEVKMVVEASDENLFDYVEVFSGKTKGQEYTASYEIADDVTDSDGAVLYPAGTAVTEKGTIENVETAEHIKDVEKRASEQEDIETAKQEKADAKAEEETETAEEN